MAEKVIEIPAIQLKRLTVTIQGQTPLITHRFSPEAAEVIAGGQGEPGPKGKKLPRNPEAEYRNSLYVIDGANEVYGFPAAGIKKALVNAGGRFTDEKMTVLRGVINILGDILPIRGDKPQMRCDMVRLIGGKTSLSYRPMFRQWEIDVPVVYDSGTTSAAQILNLFQRAGFAVGIGDWRPERNGTFGQFAIKENGVFAD